MTIFSEIEKAIEGGFRLWTERAFGPAQSDDLVLIHRAILEQIGGKIQTGGRGKRVFPYPRLVVTFLSADADRRALYQAAFGEKLEAAIRDALEAAGCEIPRGFAVEACTAAPDTNAQPTPFTIDYETRVAAPLPAAPARLTVIRGKAQQAEYLVDKPRVNIGRLAELTDSDHRVVRRNDVVFEEGADEAKGSVSRTHAHLRRDANEYRLCDDASEFGTRIFRDGRSIDVPAGNRRGEKLKAGDEIYLGRACVRFEQ
jgi:hypothetical protein